MKKIVIILGLCLFCTQQVQAEETKQEQAIKNDQTYLTGNYQLSEKPEKQKVSNHFSFFTINIQTNKTIKTNNDATR